jgi:GABA(A) receptor-associated protein
METYNAIMKTPLAKRKLCSDKLLRTYPDKIPVIVDRATKDTPAIAKHKYLIDSCNELVYLIMTIRKQMLVPKDDALFFFTENHSAVPMTVLMGTLYTSYRNADGFLYIFYTRENAFG